MDEFESKSLGVVLKVRDITQGQLEQYLQILQDAGAEKLRGNREWFELSTLPQQDVESALLELDKKSKPLLVAVDTSINIPVQNYYDIWWGNSLPHQIKQH